ncbi:hypothetical protein ACJJTC_006443 [Scirpophaga incertulas]
MRTACALLQLSFGDYPYVQGNLPKALRLDPKDSRTVLEIGLSSPWMTPNYIKKALQARRTRTNWKSAQIHRKGEPVSIAANSESVAQFWWGVCPIWQVLNGARRPLGTGRAGVLHKLNLGSATR